MFYSAHVVVYIGFLNSQISDFHYINLTIDFISTPDQHVRYIAMWVLELSHTSVW